MDFNFMDPDESHSRYWEILEIRLNWRSAFLKVQNMRFI